MAGDDEHADGPEEREGRGRSRLKRDAEALQALGESLIALGDDELATFDLPERLREAIRAAREITSRGASRRQRQYVGRLMREVDAEPIRAQLARVAGTDDAARARLHRAERWRERLIAEGDEALGALCDEFPAADRPRLRTLARQAREERAREGAPKAARELFRALRELLDAGTIPE